MKTKSDSFCSVSFGFGWTVGREKEEGVGVKRTTSYLRPRCWSVHNLVPHQGDGWGRKIICRKRNILHLLIQMSWTWALNTKKRTAVRYRKVVNAKLQIFYKIIRYKHEFLPCSLSLFNLYDLPSTNISMSSKGKLPEDWWAVFTAPLLHYCQAPPLDRARLGSRSCSMSHPARPSFK